MPTDFKKLLGARFFFTFGVQMQSVVLGWRIYELLKDPLALGMIGLAEAVPAIGFALYAGYLVDRMKPLTVYRRVILVSLCSGFIVLAEHLLQNQLSVQAQALMLYSASFLTGVARAFSQPAIFATVPRLIERSKLTRATATMSSAMQIARVAGPAAGGIIFGFFGAVTSSTLVCVLLVIAFVSVSLIRANVSPPEQTQHASVRDELLSGAKFVLNHPILFPALALDMVSVMFGGVTALLPIFASDILMVGPRGLGILRAAPAIGATVMGFYYARRSLPDRSGNSLLMAIAGFGVCILIFGMSTSFYLSLVALILSGMFDSVNMVIRSSVVQLSSPDHMRGKISAINSIFIGSSNEIGELESGIAAKLIGTVPAVYFGGVMCLMTVGFVAWFSPTLRNMEIKKLE